MRGEVEFDDAVGQYLDLGDSPAASVSTRRPSQTHPVGPADVPHRAGGEDRAGRSQHSSQVRTPSTRPWRGCSPGSGGGAARHGRASAVLEHGRGSRRAGRGGRGRHQGCATLLRERILEPLGLDRRRCRSWRRTSRRRSRRTSPVTARPAVEPRRIRPGRRRGHDRRRPGRLRARGHRRAARGRRRAWSPGPASTGATCGLLSGEWSSAATTNCILARRHDAGLLQPPARRSHRGHGRGGARRSRRAPPVNGLGGRLLALADG